jgi:hypothetical protein
VRVVSKFVHAGSPWLTCLLFGALAGCNRCDEQASGVASGQVALDAGSRASPIKYPRIRDDECPLDPALRREQSTAVPVVDCGALPSAALPSMLQAAQGCVLEAQRRGQAYVVSYHPPSYDTLESAAFVGRGDGTARSVFLQRTSRAAAPWQMHATLQATECGELREQEDCTFRQYGDLCLTCIDPRSRREVCNEHGPAQLAATLDLWAAWSSGGDEVEGYRTMRELRDAADQVVMGTIMRLRVGRIYDESAPEAVVAMGILEVRVTRVIRTTGSTPHNFRLTMMLTARSAREAHSMVDALNHSLPRQEMMFFLRALPPDSEQRVAFRLVSYHGLWMDGPGGVMAPLIERPGTYPSPEANPRPYGEELREIGNVYELADRLREP